VKGEQIFFLREWDPDAQHVTYRSNYCQDCCVVDPPYTQGFPATMSLKGCQVAPGGTRLTSKKVFLAISASKTANLGWIIHAIND
jgi:hypothetical protein